jgi:hypothetical protein
MLSTLVFFSDPDLGAELLPSASKIESIKVCGG